MKENIVSYEFIEESFNKFSHYIDEFKHIYGIHDIDKVNDLLDKMYNRNLTSRTINFNKTISANSNNKLAEMYHVIVITEDKDDLDRMIMKYKLSK